jgi:hypothetical protein
MPSDDHVMRELCGTEPVSADEQIRLARTRVLGMRRGELTVPAVYSSIGHTSGARGGRRDERTNQDSALQASRRRCLGSRHMSQVIGRS